ncbi:bifunctional 5-dehydro-2-deoxygluconokinase/5-dehydro-2-deoxyphosphogluconate aldolase [Terrarubrum flagellatum]|uniref:bifunctional 5-dehydro-2-deoxygluconokinase/5-dehydro-2- deoxyphosphogluconate aldolase n=1 Tax=Terrirubrum flagellatum TaxID=2895980 RepID=UPI0031452CDC
MTFSPTALDVICIGRSSVDLYGQQIGGRLEDVATFSKAVGGCPANISIGAARLGLRSAVITRVGDEQMGRYIIEQLGREGVETRGVTIDKERLTALVLLGVRDDHSFPHIFYRSDCADMALCEDDIEEDFIASSAAVLVTGTHFSKPNPEAAQKKAIRLAKAHGRKVLFDIDYRPNLWGLAGHAAGEERYRASQIVTGKLQTVLPFCDVIVGTEEELHIAGGSENTLETLRKIRALAPKALIVAKRGPMGCVCFPGDIPASLEDGVKGPGYPVDVLNTLGAGDGFMGGFLRGYLRDEPLEKTCAFANAGGAFAVSRLLCSAEYPTQPEMAHFLAHGASSRRLREDVALTHIHRATTRRPRSSDELMALAIDHRSQMEAMADDAGASYDRIAAFKLLALDACLKVANGRTGFGMLLDEKYGRQALYKAAGHDLWIGRPVELPGSRPLDFEYGGSLGARMIEWPVTQTIKCLCFYHPDDGDDLKVVQERELLRLADAAARVGRELLVEIICGKHGEMKDDTVAHVMARLYAIGVKPDWWKLEPLRTTAAWKAVETEIAVNDPLCRGVVMLGLDAPENEIIDAFRAARSSARVKGFAVGRTIFADPFKTWLRGAMNDMQAVDEMAARFGRLCEAWARA